MSAETHSAPALGEAGETCRECGHPLAGDQRYCLNCGRRRGEPRIDFRRHPQAEAAAGTNGATHPAAPAAPTPPQEQAPQRDYAPLAAVGGIAVLGLMLLVGVLIGKGDGGSSTTPPPQVVRIGEEGGGVTAGEESGKGQNAGAKKVGGKGSAKTAKNAGAQSAGGTGNAVVADDQALQQLQEQSPEEYQESSAKLPDEIATGGAPPPEDNKAPGGGSKGTAIE